MSYLQTLKTRFNTQELCILSAVLSMFLPFYICAIVIVGITLYLIKKGEIKKAFQATPKSRYILLFTGLSFIVSLFYQNYLGALISVGILIIMGFVLFYRQYITSDLFEYMTSCIIVLSILAAVVAMIQYLFILRSLDMDFVIKIFNKPKYRISAMFFNANYYAMMIEFFICITFYKILKLKSLKIDIKKLLFYSFVIVLNIAILILSGCRTAIPALGAGILVMLILDKRYKLCAFLFICFLMVCVFFLLNPSKFPRVDSILRYFLVRTNIWTVAIQNITTHPLFGEGPMTYMHVYKLYNGHPTQHAHNVLIDPVLSFGIIGLLTIVPYVFDNIKRLYHLWKIKIDKTLVALMVAFTIMVLVHGMLDYTIFFVQTGFLYLLIASSFEIYKDKLN